MQEMVKIIHFQNGGQWPSWIYRSGRNPNP